MTMNSIGDLARSSMMRRQSVNLKQQMDRLTQELASGKTSNIVQQLQGDYAFLGDIEHRLGVLGSYQTAAAEAKTFTGAMQSALGGIQTIATDFASQLIEVSNTNMSSVISSTSRQAVGQLDAIVGLLNTSVAGRSVFSGIATDTPALVSADDMLTQIATAAAGAASLADLETVVETWFDSAGGGFETTAYTGATQGMAPFRLGEGESIDLNLKADDNSLRQIMKHVALAALADDTTLALPIDVKQQIMAYSGQSLLADQDNLTGLRADLGFAESRIEESTARIEAEQTSSEYARGALLGVDPYKAATELQNVQLQLETLYSVTARMSRLSLMEYMR